MIKTNHMPVFSTSNALATPNAFYSSIEDVTTTTDKLTSGVTKTLGFLGAMAGTSNSTARDITRYQVNLIPASYEAESQSLAQGLVGMVAVKASSSR